MGFPSSLKESTVISLNSLRINSQNKSVALTEKGVERLKCVFTELVSKTKNPWVETVLGVKL